jgi:hypothetical protein
LCDYPFENPENVSAGLMMRFVVASAICAIGFYRMNGWGVVDYLCCVARGGRLAPCDAVVRCSFVSFVIDECYSFDAA